MEEELSEFTKNLPPAREFAITMPTPAELPTQISPEDRAKAIAGKQETKVKKAITKVTTVVTKGVEGSISNIDVFVGMLSYAAFAESYYCYSTGNYKHTIMFCFIALILVIGKHKFPDSKFTKWLNKPAPKPVVEAAKKIKDSMSAHGKKKLSR